VSKRYWADKEAFICHLASHGWRSAIPLYHHQRNNLSLLVLWDGLRKTTTTQGTTDAVVCELRVLVRDDMNRISRVFDDDV
jgi:hypothetical protein